MDEKYFLKEWTKRRTFFREKEEVVFWEVNKKNIFLWNWRKEVVFKRMNEKLCLW